MRSTPTKNSDFAEQNQALTQRRKQDAERIQAERSKAEEELRALRQETELRKQALLNDRYESEAKIQSETYDQLEKLRDHHVKKTESTKTALTEKSTHAMERAKDEKAGLLKKTQRDLDETRRSNLSALKSYQDASNDPFYRLKTASPKLSIESDGAWVSIQAPAHELAHIQIIPEDDKVVVQGTRAFSDQLKSSDGATQKTSSYQTFREELPLPYVISPKDMVIRKYSDRMEAFLPKRGTTSKTEEPKTQKKGVQERPDFPASLGEPTSSVASADKNNPQLRPKTLL